MTKEQMHEITLFAQALSTMTIAAEQSRPVQLTAQENAAVVHMVQLLASKEKEEPA